MGSLLQKVNSRDVNEAVGQGSEAGGQMSLLLNFHQIYYLRDTIVPYELIDIDVMFLLKMTIRYEISPYLKVGMKSSNLCPVSRIH